MMTGSAQFAEVHKQRFLTVREVARLLGVSAMTVYRMISDGQLPALRLRSRSVVPAAAAFDLVGGSMLLIPHDPLGSACLDVAVVARILRVSKATIYRLVQDGELWAVRLRGRVIVPGNVIDKMAAAHCRPDALVLDECVT
jgi:excisionase family DNA binding protein